LDGDGLDDVAVIILPDNMSTRIGSLQILFSSELDGVSLDEAPSITGVQEERLWKTNFAPLGDIDGDGSDELAVWFIKTPSGEDHFVEFGVVPGSDVPKSGSLSLEPYLRTVVFQRGGKDFGVPCDLDGDGLPELVSESGIWRGTELLDLESTPVAPGIPSAACLGDLDGDGTSEVGFGEYL
jgi:hypothetical protein